MRLQMNMLFFTEHLLNWFGDEKDKRDLPWKKTTDPYAIWISEIILQQTQVKQGLNYYLRFLEVFPNVKSLAEAPEDDVLACWKGLGYYSRARNLHQAAKYIVNELNGVFPNTYKDILRLKGVGPYSAAAIASFAFREPKAVVDGNVYRVLARFFAVQKNIQTSKGKHYFQELADQLLDEDQPDRYNQAIMDFGAIQCKPVNPLCDSCPLSTQCQAYLSNTINDFPVKNAAKKRRKRFFHFLVIEYSEGVLMEKRSGKDVWEGLYQFPLIETEGVDTIKINQWQDFLSSNAILSKIDPNKIFKQGQNKQLLSHQEINAVFYRMQMTGKPLHKLEHQLISIENLSELPMPKIVNDFVHKIILT